MLRLLARQFPRAEFVGYDPNPDCAQEIAANCQVIADWQALSGRYDLLVWGAGDNFYRMMSNEGPLTLARNIVLLDSSPRTMAVNGRTFTAVAPEDGLCQSRAPVVITVSEASAAIIKAVHAHDPNRETILF